MTTRKDCTALSPSETSPTSTMGHGFFEDLDATPFIEFNHKFQGDRSNNFQTGSIVGIKFKASTFSQQIRLNNNKPDRSKSAAHKRLKISMRDLFFRSIKFDDSQSLSQSFEGGGGGGREGGRGLKS